MVLSLTCAGSAVAHFPISRGVAVSKSGATAIALPGFGLAVRSTPAEPFSYVCDALLDVAPTDATSSLAFASDGSLVIGSPSGLRSTDVHGCPLASYGGDLRGQPVARVAVHPAQPDIVYAVTSGTLPRVWRSGDGGKTWGQGGALIAINPVTGLALDPSDPDVLYVSQSTPGNGGTLHVSKDGGASFSKIDQDAFRTVLDVEPADGDAGTSLLWAVGRSATATGIQGFSLFSASAPAGPWTPHHDVRFYGGFAREPGGTLWFGDEAGGVFRSTDSGGSFTDVSSTTAVSCLDFANGTLFACTPGLATQKALVTWDEPGQALNGVIMLSNVTRKVECAPPIDVATKCAAAWVEWQRDILMLPPPSVDAGTPPTGTGGASAGTGGSGPVRPLPDAGTGGVPPDAATSPSGERDSSSGCAVTTHADESSLGGLLAALCVALAVARRR